jgi:hypothetical protein
MKMMTRRKTYMLVSTLGASSMACGKEVSFCICSMIIHIMAEIRRTAMALVHEQTILTVLTLLVGEVSTNFCGQRVTHGQRNGSPGRIFSF